MSIKQKAIQGVIWSVIQNWGSQAGSLIVFLILARLLTPQAFGLIGLANVFLAFMQIFLEQGFSQALIQRQEIDPEELDTAFWTHVLSGLLLTIISFFLAGFVSNIFEQPKLIPILQCFSFLFFINSLSHVHKAILSREFAFKIMAVRTIIGIIIGGTVGIVMALSGFGVWSLVSQQFIYEAVEVFIIWGAIDWRPKFRFSFQHLRNLLNFGSSILALKFLNFCNKRTDNLLIGYFLGEVALGYYMIAYRVLEVMTQLLVSTTKQVALPTFSRLQTEPERFRQAFYKVTLFTSLIAFPTFFGMITLTKELVISLFGERWLPSVPVMQVLAFAGILNAISFFNGSVFIAIGKPSWKLWLSLLNAVLNLIACLVAVQWGIVGVALAYVISSYIAFPVSQWAISKLIHVPLLTYLQQFRSPLIGSVVMVSGILIAKHFMVDLINEKVLILVGTAIGTIIYGLTIRLVDPKLFKDLLELLKMIRSPSKIKMSN
ncbi:lipopolysaccharide biosynthesis protein [Limnoraphis robusta]|uniref:Lipopolysaccharide biosynthesis protein n=1 Tax=Limnoraphis robusta CCNP1315 TaxID=3110306 RepID=A0ABU5TV76_9CYAN|nr:lipopolysaccharide biosynthesis protein [Limnoraphis robusta]MEA5518556.1 lipopolysaccharide biosynthesis protein [Limnoraphis robusta CCNP1315]MEA5548609.1 lipopolysaccharide biosynthesis protein [Limnoraphis robusta CCNP1324]